VKNAEVIEGQTFVADHFKMLSDDIEFEIGSFADLHDNKSATKPSYTTSYRCRQ